MKPRRISFSCTSRFSKAAGVADARGAANIVVFRGTSFYGSTKSRPLILTTNVTRPRFETLTAKQGEVLVLLGESRTTASASTESRGQSWRGLVSKSYHPFHFGGRRLVTMTSQLD